jgi:LPS-assembly lipoprotein
LLAGLGGALVSGCTVQPLYSAPSATPAIDASAASSMSMQSALSSVGVAPLASRQGVIVRNRLIFLMGQGAGEARSPAYTLKITLRADPQSRFALSSEGEDISQPTATVLALTGTYILSENGGALIARGARTATAAYDTGSQGFAERAALADAEERAGVELAEMIHLAVAQALASR